jgi:hypothetical protein
MTFDERLSGTRSMVGRWLLVSLFVSAFREGSVLPLDGSALLPG